MGIENISAGNLQLIVPNLHRRYSGVTATNRMVAPKLAKAFRAAWLGPDAPDGIARMRVADLLKLWRRRDALIWHARRNNEMIAGVVLRSLGWPLKLVFTSAAQRQHTWITRWLIRTDGCDHRHQRHLGVIPQTRSHRDSARRRYRSLCAASRSRGGVRGKPVAGPLRHRLLRPGARAERQRRVRGGDVPAVAALSRFHRGHGRRDHAGAIGLCQRAEKADRGGGPAIAHRHHRRACRSRRCSAGTGG